MIVSRVAGELSRSSIRAVQQFPQPLAQLWREPVQPALVDETNLGEIEHVNLVLAAERSQLHADQRLEIQQAKLGCLLGVRKNSSIFLQNRGLRNHRGGVAPGAVSLPGADGSTVERRRQSHTGRLEDRSACASTSLRSRNRSPAPRRSSPSYPGQDDVPHSRSCPLCSSRAPAPEHHQGRNEQNTGSMMLAHNGERSDESGATCTRGPRVD